MTNTLTNLKTFFESHKLEICIFFFALTVRCVVAGLALAHEPLHTLGADGGDYMNEATNLLEGHGFSRSYNPPYLPDAIRTPLYPLFLAGVYWLFGDFVAVVCIEVLFSSLLPVLFIRMVKLFTNRWSLVVGGAVFLSVEPHLVFNTIFFGSEGISILLLTWGLFELVKVAYTSNPRKEGLRAGFVLGLSTLARPITIYLPMVLVPLFVCEGLRKNAYRRALQVLGIFLLGFLLTISPWLIRNAVVFGSPAMGTIGWFNVYTRLAATVQAIDTGDDFYTSYHKLLDELSVRGYVHHPPPVSELEIQDPRFGEVLRAESFRVLGEHQRAVFIYALLYPLSVLTQDNTLGYLSYLGLPAFERPSFSPTLYVAQHGISAALKAVAPYLLGLYIVPYLMRLLFFVLFVLATIGTFILWRRKEHYTALLLFGFIGYVVLFSLNAGGQIDGRYRSQFLIPETVLAAVALEKYLERRKHVLHSKIAP